MSEQSESEDSADLFYDARDDNFDWGENPFFYECDRLDCDSDLDEDECSSENDDDDCGIAEWAAEYNIPQTALSALLKILRRKGLDVPLDARTLMSTDRSCNVSNVDGGSYYHFGIRNAVVAELKTLGHVPDVTTLTLRINIDGLPLFRSSNMSLWPILGSIKEIPECNVFVIGVYSGRSKPANV